MDITVYDETNKLKEKEIEWMQDLLQFAAKKLTVSDSAEMSITVVTNEKIKEINHTYRNKNTVTDVISFAMEDEEDVFFEIEEELFPRDLGDLFVSYTKAVEQANDYGHSVDRELGFLVVHGFLHLNGYDHQTANDEKEMFSLQEEILEDYGLRR